MSQGGIQAIRRPGASKSEWVLGLFVGLSILTMIRFVPYIGGLVRLGVVCLGWERLLHSFIALHDR